MYPCSNYISAIVKCIALLYPAIVSGKSIVRRAAGLAVLLARLSLLFASNELKCKYGRAEFPSVQTGAGTRVSPAELKASSLGYSIVTVPFRIRLRGRKL